MVKATLLTLAAIAGFFSLLFAPGAQATPIRPDLQKLMSQGQESTIHFAPARAGWQGPEMSPAPAKPSAAAGLLDDSEAAQRMREELMALAVPDLRALALIVLAIFLMRQLRHRASRSRATTAPQPMLQPPVASLQTIRTESTPLEESPPAKAA